MADNTTLQSTTLATPPEGLIVAGDDIGGALYQRVKPAWGADGVATDVSTSAPLPVTGYLSSSTGVIGAVMPSTQWTVTTTPSSQITASVSPTTQWTVANATSTGIIGAVMPSTTWDIGTVATVSSLTTGSVAAAQSGSWSVAVTSSTAVRGSVMPSSQWTVSVTPTTQFSVTTTPSSVVNVVVNSGSVTLTSGVLALGTVAVTSISSSTTVKGSVMPSSQWTVTTTPSSKVDVTQVPATTGGLSIVYKSLGITVSPIATTTCQLYGWHIYNSNSSAAYIQLTNATTGNVTIGSPTMSIGIPATSGANVHFNSGIAFATALSMVATAGATSTSSCANLVEVNFFYK